MLKVKGYVYVSVRIRTHRYKSRRLYAISVECKDKRVCGIRVQGCEGFRVLRILCATAVRVSLDKHSHLILTLIDFHKTLCLIRPLTLIDWPYHLSTDLTTYNSITHNPTAHNPNTFTFWHNSNPSMCSDAPNPNPNRCSYCGSYRRKPRIYNRSKSECAFGWGFGWG